MENTTKKSKRKKAKKASDLTPKEQAQKAENGKIARMLQAIDRKLKAQHQWDISHVCNIHHVVLTTTGKCHFC